jgi:hypothetical protein
MTLRRGLLWFLLLALVAVQALGLVHSVAHADRSASASGFAVGQAEADDESGHRRESGLFGGHDDDAGCLLYDQLSHGGCLPVPAAAAALPMIPPAFFLQWFQGEFLARWAALFDARGPPPVR